MADDDLLGLSIAGLASVLEGRQASPVDVTSAYLKRIEALNERLRAYVTVNADGAMSAAAEAEREIGAGRYRGPLHGVPLSLKDLIDVEGLPTTNGSLAYENNIADADATVTSRLRQAGATILGKDNMYEFAMGVTVDPPYGTFRNPWNDDHSPGGSSSGTGVAVSARLSAGGLGSDTGGSVRIPSSYCGIVGLKPTWGLVSDHGVMPMCYSMDAVGPMARTAEDAALLLQAIAGHDPRATRPVHAPEQNYAAELSEPVNGLRLGIIKELFPHPDLDGEVEQAVQRAMAMFEELGCSLTQVSIPHSPMAAAVFTGAEEPEVVGHRWKPLVEHNARLDSNTRVRLTSSALIPAAFTFRARQARRLICDEVRDALAGVDALIIPTSPTAAPLLQSTATRNTREKVVGIRRTYTCLFNLSGHPALTVPCGFTEEGLPMGLQLVGDYFADGLLLRLAHHFQQVTDWHQRRPPV